MRNKLVYGKWTFTDGEITDGNPYQEQTLFGRELGVDTLSVTVKCEDPEILNDQPGAYMIYCHRERQRGIYFVQSVQQVTPQHYVISGVTAEGRLTQLEHPGGIYTGESLEQVVREICGPLTVYVKTSVAQIPIYGWLPYVKPPDSSARDNLALLLQATGTYLGVDLNGALRVEPLWSGLAGTVTEDSIYVEASVERASPVSAVLVAEHQYVPGEEEQTLFEGTASSGDPIIFDEPMHSLSATGFTILESGANWARLAPGTGVLTGKRYVHTTRQLTAAVTPSAVNSVEALEDNTLITLANARDVLNRMADYYRCLKTIQTPILVDGARPGHIVSIYDPFAKTMVNACISTMDITMSAVLKAETSALVGFVPPQPDSSDYIDERVVLTGAGEWNPPDGVHLVTYALISGAYGGYAGAPGEPGGEAVEYRGTTSLGVVERGWYPGEGGKGGEPGQPGPGGKILLGEMALDGTPVPYRCGEGGEGSTSPTELGPEGEPTVFGPASSADGAASADGYTDPITGERYALAGTEVGCRGGDAGGKIPEQSPGPENAGQFQPATDVIGPDGTVWKGGATKTRSDGPPPIIYYENEYNEGEKDLYAAVSVAPGSGAAVGSDGKTSDALGTMETGFELGAYFARAWSIPGLDGADAVISPLPNPLPTMGGAGGHGGGGGAPCGLAAVSNPSEGTYATAAEPGRGGRGSPGGKGGKGLIILYYRRPKPAQALLAAVTRDNLWRLDRFGRRCIV